MTHVGALIHRSLEGDIEPAEQTQLDEHVGVCERCRRLNTELRRNDVLLAQRDPLPALPPRRRPRPSPFRVVSPALVATATLLLALIAGTQLAQLRADIRPAASGTPAPTIGTPLGAPASAMRVGPDAPACAIAASTRAYLATFSDKSSTDLHCSLYMSADGERWERAPLELRTASGQPYGAQQPYGEGVLAVGINSATGSLFAGTTYGRILRADGLGAPWRIVFEPPAGTFQPVVTGFFFDGQRGYAAMKGLLVSDDDGRTWRDSSVGIGSFRPGLETRGRFGTSAPVRSMNDIFLGIGGVLEGTTGMWATADSGRSWRRVEGAGTGEHGLAARDGLVVVALPNPFDQSGKPTAPARASADGGRTWRDTATLPRGVSIRSLVATWTAVVAGTTDGVFLLDRDLTWTELSARPRLIRALAFTGTQLYAASQEDGLWRFELPKAPANPNPGTVVEIVDENTVRVELESPMMSAEFGNPVLLQANKSTEIVPSASTIAATGVKVGDRVGVAFERDGRDPSSGAYPLSIFRVVPEAVSTVPPAALSQVMVVGPIQRLTERVGWVTTDKGLSRTDDGGVTWREIVVPSSRITELRFIDELRGWAVMFVERDQPQVGCAQASTASPCRSVVAITTDGGETWQERLSIPFSPAGPGTIRGLQAIDMSTAWVIAQNAPCDANGCPSELRGTTDGGRTWVPHRAATNAVVRFASAQRGWLFATAQEGDSVVLVTSDGGTSWRTGLTAAPQQALTLDAASSSVAWALTRDGAYCTASSCSNYELFTTMDGGATWTSLGNPKTQASCTGHLRGPLFASETVGWLGLSLGAGGGGPGGIMRTRDGGRTWDCRTDPANVTAVSAADPRHVWALSDRRDGSAWLYQSDDGGDSWRRVR